MPGEQHVSARRNIHGELINAGHTQITICEHRTGHAVTSLTTASGELQRPTCKIATGIVFNFQHMNATALGLQGRIHVVDPISQRSAEQALESSHHKGL